MSPDPHDTDVPPILEREAQEAREALAAVLGEAGIGLPQLDKRPEAGTWCVELGACNVVTAQALVVLCQDGMTLRKEAADRGE